MKCTESAEFKIYWPGEKPNYFCLEHATKALNVARYMGEHLELEPLNEDENSRELTCCQK